MKDMKNYKVTYYINPETPYTYDFAFETLYGAIYTARSIFDRHGLVTDVMDCETGEILAIFEPNNFYVADEVSAENKKLALIEMR